MRSMTLQIVRHVTVIVFLMTCCRPLGAAGLSKAEIVAVERAVRTEMKQQRIVGLALGLIRDGQVVYTKGFGFEDRDRQIAVTPQTLFRWASVSKPLTALAAWQLVEKQRLDLNADVRKLVPEFPDKGAKITARQLLCHQGGIVHYTNGKLVRSPRAYRVAHPFEDCVQALDTFRESPLVAAPGTRFSYSTHGYILLSAVVQRAGRQKFAAQVSERIARPLGMTTLQPDYQWKTLPHRAVGYRLRENRIVESTNTDVSWKLGGGGFVSNITDMALLASGLINGRLVSPATETRMWTPQTTSSGQATPVGLGFFVEQQNGTLKVSHNGAQEKTRTRLVIYPRRKHGAVVMCNSEYAKPGRVTTTAYQALAAVAEAKRNPLSSSPPEKPVQKRPKTE
ncbi:MAG: serine hydrolase domain-containing protein [Planctomycetaceae bacterium]